MIDLDEFYGFVGPIILVDVPNLEFFWLGDVPKWWSQSTKTTLPNGVTSLAGEDHGGVSDLALRCLQLSMMLWRSS
jgi:hypothetical protein